MASTPAISTLRLLLRVANAFTLDLLTIYRGERDFTDAVILAVLMQRKSAWLAAHADDQRRHATVDTPVAGDQRGAISVNALATSLGLPFETVRRRTKRLLADGLCERVANGVCISAGLLASDEHRHALGAAYDTVRTLYWRLRRTGCVELMDLARSSELFPLSEERPVGIVWRASADYFLRIMELVLPNIPGGLTQGFVLMEVIRANTAEMSDAQRGEDRLDAAAGVADRHRRPVRTSEVARALRLPQETVRRNLIALVESERCQQNGDGFIVPAAALARPNIMGAFVPNFQNLRRMFCQLADTGVLTRWDAEVEANSASLGIWKARP